MIIKIPLLICIFLSFLVKGSEINTDSELVSNPQHTLFTDIINNHGNLVAVGKHGVIITSTDSINWQQAKVPVQALLTSVTYTDKNNMWACGHDSTILHSIDKGASWQIQKYQPETAKPCLDIEFYDDKTGFAIGAYGMFFKTQDGGNTWEKQFITELLHPDDKEYLNELKRDDIEAYEEEIKFILPHFNRLFIKDKTLYMVGEMGLFAISTDLGQSWRRVEEFYNGSLFTVSINEQNLITVAGLRGNAFFSDLKNLAFEPINTDSTATINSAIILGSTTKLVANSGFIFTINGRKEVTSNQLSSGTSILSAATFENQLILATEKGIINHTGGGYE
jgi:photosystem II stability/assembly factor-like uncharacterized protein